MDSFPDLTSLLSLLPFQEWLLPLFSFIFFSLVKLGVYSTKFEDLQDSILQIGQEFGSMGIGFFFVSVFNFNSKLHAACRSNLKGLLFLIIFSMIILTLLYGLSVLTYKIAKTKNSNDKIFGLLQQRYCLWGVSYISGIISLTSTMRLL